MSSFRKDSSVMDHELKVRSLNIRCRITGNATPASKIHNVDLPGIVELSTEGITSAAQAIEAVTFATESDGATNSAFGFIIDGSELGNGEGIESVYSIELYDKSGSGGAMTVAGIETDGLTAGGNIAGDITGTGLDLEAENADIILKIVYKLK